MTAGDQAALEGDDDHPPCNIPIRFSTMLGRLNEALAQRGQLVHTDGRGYYRLIDTTKAKALSVYEVEALARQVSAIAPIETVMQGV
jgi:hypothetical protein